MHGRIGVAGGGLAVVIVTLFGAPAMAAAGDTVVTTTRDCAEAGCGSLRAALASPSAGETIRVPAGEYRVERELSVRASATVVGEGAGRTVIVAAGGRALRVGDPQAPQRPRVRLSQLELASGVEPYGSGGNVLNHADLELDRVRVRDGRAGAGGGVANLGGTLVITRSVIDHNAATSTGGLEEGGGVYSASVIADALVVNDSTIAYNTARAGAGVAIDDTSGGQARAGVLERVTLARNRASETAPGGLRIGRGAQVEAIGMIVAENTAAITAARAADRPSNCDGPSAPLDGGGNLADTADCGFAATPQNARLGPGFAGSLPALPLLPGSPALDRVPGCTGLDQRGVERPQGIACDAGAYELAAPVIDVTPPALAAGADATFTFVSDVPDVSFECRLDGPAGGGAWVPCTSPVSYSGLAAGNYLFAVRVPSTTAQANRTFAMAAPLAAAPVSPPPRVATPAQVPPPQPRYRRSVVLRPTKGTVRVRLPGSTRYVKLESIDTVPFGASIDARNGRVRLHAARNASGATQAASFYGGVFRVLQRGAVIELQLRGPKPVCARSSAQTSQLKPRKKRQARTRKLWGSGKGSFRTSGRYSAATVRGTTWLVQDSCRSTTTRVKRGVVSVRDFARKRTIRLRAGDRYVARRR